MDHMWMNIFLLLYCTPRVNGDGVQIVAPGAQLPRYASGNIGGYYQFTAAFEGSTNFRYNLEHFQGYLSQQSIVDKIYMHTEKQTDKPPVHKHNPQVQCHGGSAVFNGFIDPRNLITNQPNLLSDYAQEICVEQIYRPSTQPK